MSVFVFRIINLKLKDNAIEFASDYICHAKCRIIEIRGNKRPGLFVKKYCKKYGKAFFYPRGVNYYPYLL
jgi:hypothetical protein